MLLERLTLSDVGTYRGRHTFDLAPRLKGGRQRPVILLGGLNGAGKTTFLVSVRLALYGRQSLDAAMTQRGYDEALRALIHVPLNQLVRADRAYVELEFTHARFGERIRYRVERSWLDKVTKVDETLRVFKDGDQEPLLEGDAAQGFLSQLVPAGVSQFFFFDGERISALANDDSDEVLAEAIRRLLGLDIADRLDSDLSVFLRARKAEGLDVGSRQELKELQAQYREVTEAINAEERELTENLVPELDSARQEVDRARSLLSDHGGAWAVDRSALERQLDELDAERRALEESARDRCAGMAVFALAPKLCNAVIATVKSEQDAGDRAVLVRRLGGEVETLKIRLSGLARSSIAKKELACCIDAWVADIVSDGEKATKKPTHGLTKNDADAVLEVLGHSAPAARRELQSIVAATALRIGRQVEIQDKLAHAPSQESIHQAFERYQRATRVLAELEVKRELHIANMRSRLWIAIMLNRRMRKVEERVRAAGTIGHAEQIAEAIQGMIASFKAAAAQEKCRILEKHFVNAFRRLARKEDVIRDARIDPTSFAVTLINRQGTPTSKARLSAGEKQIFAIAMLEALAKTSGRNLPIIIDTPLGRLDSMHRSNLVESYFPVASHQVVVLSTDTEVDQPFYEELRLHISHAFHLAFDEQEGCTTVTEGYFWKHKEFARAA